MKDRDGREIVSPLDRMERRMLSVNLDVLLPVVHELLATEATLVMSAIDLNTGVQHLPVDIALLRAACNRLEPDVAERILTAVGLGAVPEAAS